MFVVTGCNRIKAEQVNNNNANEFNAPSVVFIKVTSQHFILDVLNVYQPRLDYL
jgi:hypothetical protein